MVAGMSVGQSWTWPVSLKAAAWRVVPFAYTFKYYIATHARCVTSNRHYAAFSLFIHSNTYGPFLPDIFHSHKNFQWDHPLIYPAFSLAMILIGTKYTILRNADISMIQSDSTAPGKIYYSLSQSYVNSYCHHTMDTQCYTLFAPESQVSQEEASTTAVMDLIQLW